MKSKNNKMSKSLNFKYSLESMRKSFKDNCSINNRSIHVISNYKLHYKACATICTFQNLNYKFCCEALLWRNE